MSSNHPVFGEAYQPSMSMAKLAKLARVSVCPTAATAAASGLNLESLVTDTPYHDPGGIPLSAFARGATMERLLRENGHALLISLCREHLGFELADVVAVNLREQFSRNRKGLAARAKQTRRHLERMLAGVEDAANLLEGAVLEYRLNGGTRYAEVDAFGVKAGGKLHVIEVKSHPLVDGQLLGGAKPQWKLQMGMYLSLAQDVATDLGFDPDEVVSTNGLLILAKNATVQPTGMMLDLRDDLELARLTLERLAAHDAEAALAAVEPELLPVNLPSLPEENDPARDEAVAARLQHVAGFVDSVGIRFGPECADACDLYKFCRARAAGRIDAVDTRLARAAGALSTFEQVAEVAADPDRAPASATGTAQQLAEAARHRELAARLSADENESSSAEAS